MQAAIGVIPSLIPGGSWVGCSNVVDYSRFDLLSDIRPVYTYLLSTLPTGRYLVYSGDVDLIVPFSGTRNWMTR